MLGNLQISGRSNIRRTGVSLRETLQRLEDNVNENIVRPTLRLLLAFTLLASAALSLEAQTPGATPAEAAQAATPPPTQAPATPASTQPTGPQTQPGAQPTRNPDGTFTIRRTARLVILDVVVTDKQGNVVRDLKKSDFHVTESDQPQDILNFEETGAHLADTNADIESTADLDRIAPRAPVNIILLDEFNTRFEDMAFARYSLKKFLEKQPDKLSTPTMLIAVSLQKFEVLRDYTENKQQLIDALDHHFGAYPWQAHNGGWLAERYGTAFQTLMRVAQAVVGHPGHKNMIWIGRGFPALNFANVALDTANRVDNYVQECVNMLRDARVTLYTIDPAGLQVNNTYGAAAQFNDPFGGNYEFAKLATATGGRALYGRNDVDAEIGTTVRDGASFYTLTYRPDSNDNPQKFRKIKVAIPDRPGLIATTREGYYIQRGPGRVDPTNPSRRLALDLTSAGTSTMVYDGVPLTLMPSKTDPDTFRILVDAKALNWTFATDTEPRHAEVVLMTSTFDKKGKELKQVAKIIRAQAPATVPPTGRIERPILLETRLDHDPKAVRARFVIRVSASGRMGTADAALSPQGATVINTTTQPAQSPAAPPAQTSATQPTPPASNP